MALNLEYRYAGRRYAEYRNLFIVMLLVVLLSIVMLIVVAPVLGRVS